jgi:hypothetical protein
MKFSELVSYAKEYPKGKRKDLLIIISAFKEYGNVTRHLEMLAKQDFQAFDVLLILGIPFDDKKMQEYLKKSKFKFSVIMAKENERRGCSGGFFTGQKYALEKGYKYAIMADDDCMPVDKTLVEALYANREKRFVSCITNYAVTKDFKVQQIGSSPTQYTLFDTDVWKKYGLYYLPLFHGADDAEYVERIKEPRTIIKKTVDHPYSLGGNFIFGNLDRAMVFFNAALIIVKDIHSVLYNLCLFSVYLPIYLFFLPDYGRKIFATMLKLLLTCTYGKKAIDAMNSGFRKFIFEKKEAEFSGFEKVYDKNPEHVADRRRDKIQTVLSESISMFRKDVVVLSTFSYLKVVMTAVFAKRLYARVEDGKYLLMADNSNPLLHLARLVGWAIFTPLFAIMMFLLFLPIKAIKQPNTMGYGLD